MNGIINVLKPTGLTSNKVVNIIKHKIGASKVGHLGTLDPNASGVLPVCINKATKLFDYYLNKNKEYIAVFEFGTETDTLDAEGEIIKKIDVFPTKEQILKVLPNFIGKINQMPPKYSAKNIGGVRAYKLARENIDFELQPKLVEIFDIQLIEKLDEKTYKFKISCSSGTYIRSIVRDIANKLNTVGFMLSLVRTKSGDFNIENSVELDNVTIDSIVPIEKILKNMQNISLFDALYDKIINGMTIEVNLADTKNILVFCKQELIGIGSIQNSFLKIKTNLRG